MYEHRTKPLAPRRVFLVRVARSAGCSALLLATCLGVGVGGYHFIEGLAWIDALLNASMILSGMGPVNPLQTTGGKLFASFYALLSGVAFISTMGLLLAAPLHRLLHRFRLELNDDPHKKLAHAPDRPKPAAMKPGTT